MKIIYAFFDVDETILNFKSMFDFYRYWLCRTNKFGHLGGYVQYYKFLKNIKYQSNFHDREEVNKMFYMEYAGVCEDRLKEIGYAWCKEKLKFKKNFHNQVLHHYNSHKINDVKTVLVSGSMGQCLEPLKIFLNADYAIWSDLEVKNGILTGGLLDEPNIGLGKARRILKFLEKQSTGYDLSKSYAYGDHSSDIPMLSLVGNSYWVRNGIPQKFILNS